MTFGFETIIGTIAATLTTSSFLPQIFRAYKTKSMDDVSKYLMAVFSSGTALWVVYGVVQNDPVIIGANSIATALALILLYFKVTFKNNGRS